MLTVFFLGRARAKTLGYHVVVLQASGARFRLYERVGFQSGGIFKKFQLT